MNAVKSTQKITLFIINKCLPHHIQKGKYKNPQQLQDHVVLEQDEAILEFSSSIFKEGFLSKRKKKLLLLSLHMLRNALTALINIQITLNTYLDTSLQELMEAAYVTL